MIREVYRSTAAGGEAIGMCPASRRGVAGSVLIVDDDPTIVESLRRVLPPEVELSSAKSAAGAAALLDEKPFCGLVLSLVLLDSDGFEVLRHMKTQQLVVPTVVVTEKLPSYVREMLDQEQVKLVFPKPVEPLMLAAIVRGFCGMA
jgi:DNA-binding NtrC family response regulator